MKKFHVFILIFAGSFTLQMSACGFYPYGENLRFCFFKPEYFGFGSYAEFNYSSQLFAPAEASGFSYVNQNEQLWFEYCKRQVPVSEISLVLNSIPKSNITAKSANKMIAYLFAAKDKEAIDYLLFAKDCEMLNMFYEDPWERNADYRSPMQKQFIDKAITLSKTVKNQELSMRYTFLAIRMSFYNGTPENIRQLYDSVFKLQSKKNILNYWSLYFRAFAEKDKALADFYAAQVFAHAPEKRFAVYSQLYRDIPVASVLKYAATDEERANVYILKNIMKSDKALDGLVKTYAEDPDSEGLDFLLLREINKIEDWVFTPYYSLFSPSISNDENFESSRNTIAILNRVQTDRNYAAQVLAFVQSADLKKVRNPVFWEMAKVQLLFTTQQYEKALGEINRLEQKINPSKARFNELGILKALCLTANQSYGNATIPLAAQQVILKNSNDYKFLFALGRELENKGNTTDAALLYSKLTTDSDDGDWSEQQSNVAYWKMKNSKRKQYFYDDYYSNYFDYLNVVYTTQQVQTLIDDINKQLQKTSENEFETWKYALLKKQINRLYDLLGTKFIREDKLEMASAAYEKVQPQYWANNYTNWERNDLEKHFYDYGGNQFDNNPFYQLKNTATFIPERKPFRLTKTSITKHLIRYLALANNPLEKDRDYYYFLVANCYYNMSWYGNAWMMRRFYRSSADMTDPDVTDDVEYRSCDLAKKYYLEALKNAKTEKFKALCLRMATSCHSRGQRYLFGDDYVKQRNPYDVWLQRDYKEDYDDVMSSCTFFKDYFAARR